MQQLFVSGETHQNNTGACEVAVHCHKMEHLAEMALVKYSCTHEPMAPQHGMYTNSE